MVTGKYAQSSQLIQGLLEYRILLTESLLCATKKTFQSIKTVHTEHLASRWSDRNMLLLFWYLHTSLWKSVWMWFYPRKI